MVHNDVPQPQVKIKSPVRVKEEPILGLPDSSSPGGGDDDDEALQSLKKGPWSVEEDALLMEYVKKYGEGNWNAVQKNMGLQRCGKSCRLRWSNHLRPNLIKGSFTQEEENLIIKYHAELGNKWARMATYLPGRTDNEIKNFWNTRVKRRQRAGLPLYPTEIQAQIAMKKRQRAFMLMQNQVRPINDEYLLRNFDLSLPWQQRQASTFPFKTEHLSTNLYPRYISDQIVTPQPMSLAMGQANNALIDDMLRESQRPRELFNQELPFEHLSANSTAIMEPLPSSKLPPPSNSEHLAMNPLYKLSDSNISIGLPAKKQTNQNVSNLSKTKLIDTTPMPTTKLYDTSSVMMADDDLWLDMQRLVSKFSTTNDWKFESSSWENTPR